MTLRKLTPWRRYHLSHDLHTQLGLVSGRVYNFVDRKKKLAVTIILGKWSERYGCDLEGFPIQSLGIDCGIFMLMSALYVALEAPFDYSIADMPTLRKWWCVLLMENFELDSLGRLFAHWTEESKPVIEGNHMPVFRLPKRKQVEVCQEPAVARDLHVAMLWVQSNEKLFRGHVTAPRFLAMDVQDRQKAIDNLKHSDDLDNLDPFLFVFQYKEDMEQFLKNCVDNQHLRVNTMFLLP
ncbi:uncharacterized protein [Paramormyrops kingsleyae]|uniref:uncharacterized protein n=1 Tax=Paramormyrops kingsleyae TaxID=1676925 RepID=UPI003B97AE61